MKTAAAFVAGIALAAPAASFASGYWEKNEQAYTCYGIPKGVTCKIRGTKYEVTLGGKILGVTHGTQRIFLCDPRNRPAKCFDVR